jgi:phenylpyruvate tautomerase PptA (4-oxalocrotonate tautomerase family)
LETPFIDLKIDPMPTAEQAGLLARGITDALVEVVGKRREVTVVRIDGSAAILWTIGRDLARRPPIWT